MALHFNLTNESFFCTWLHILENQVKTPAWIMWILCGRITTATSFAAVTSIYSRPPNCTLRSFATRVSQLKIWHF
jgi:hypothetical protein